MSLFVVEGARKSGKSFLVNSQNWLPIFKFDFNPMYTSLELFAKEGRPHHIGLGKELMIHQLNRDGFLQPLIMDRGVLTNSVWGVLNDRVTEKSVINELDYMVDNDLFKKSQFFYIDGTYTKERSKDVWDYMDEKIPEERRLFDFFINHLLAKGVKISIIENKFDIESLSNFQMIIKNLR